MEIHLVSSLTPEDESRLAPVMLTAINDVLTRLPVSYSVRIEMSAGSAIQHHHTAAAAGADDEPVAGPVAEVRFPKA
ncbi:MAG TPA: hypothetical protein VGK32_10475 [Vicinamibacterales bacterium]|jgi:hypothetical protein